MEYTMRLAAKPFERMRNGSKSIELRLCDEKREKIRPGDTILFTRLDSPDDTLQREVSAIYRFSCFEELYQALPLCDLGYSEDEIPMASSRDMEEFYSQEEQAKYGVMGLRLVPVSQTR